MNVGPKSGSLHVVQHCSEVMCSGPFHGIVAPSRRGSGSVTLKNVLRWELHQIKGLTLRCRLCSLPKTELSETWRK
jgi:hypothetical protein